ncbi:hypothetical protein GH975_03600 [Litorivicinus lipolyticus]|uniref:RDD domain-containing protein n=1 Tax=Litorivicinus lipolyticus TaxID=418701 RepID=A0A5Q2QBL5_9GAMM|nr:RDD family protein [Litorivicinus lipolyticus]QGG79701.1 hypothetical protein GH975_03600 [Litorivicinus lipolyticus]
MTTSEIDPKRPALGPATWFGRLAAGLYDAFILLAIWLLLGSVVTFAFGGTPDPRVVQLVCMAAAWALFGYLWTKTGRTLGMQAWHLRLESQTGGLMTWKQATSRFAWMMLFNGGFWLGAILLGTGQVALGGALMVTGLVAFASAYGQPDRRTWYDRASGTRLVRVAKVKST